MQKIAIDWVRKRTENSALRVLAQIGAQEEKLAGRLRDCRHENTKDLESVRKLATLMRDDISKRFDVATLQAKETARQEKASAERLKKL